MAEALLAEKGAGKFEVASAGIRAAARVNPLAIEALANIGISWEGRSPRTVDGLARKEWDYVITVCDNAKESCPILPGHPVAAHWGMEDPTDVTGTHEEQLRAFTRGRDLLARRIDLMVALPFAKLPRLAIENRLRAIPTEVPADS